MMTEKPFWLFCAGEDSGDILGKEIVQEILGKGFVAIGVGGIRMQSAGLLSVIPFDDLPVNGFFDVLRHFKILRRHFAKLSALLQNENCQGLVAIDYPGFNLKLMQQAIAQNKKVIYVEPPQIWAWKPKRIQKFLSPEARKLVELRALYPIEIQAYEKFGLHVQKIPHPFSALPKISVKKNAKTILLFPGSRLSQAKRNLKLYAFIAYKLTSKNFQVKFVASRKNLQNFFVKKLHQKFPIILSPASAEERNSLFRSAAAVICGPGSAVVEAHLAETPILVASRIEPLTYLLGKFFLRTTYLSLPNIETEIFGGSISIPEIVQCTFSSAEKQGKKVLDIAQERGIISLSKS